MSNCGILHIKTAPYHPQTNGEAERFVQTFKNFIKRADHDKSMNQRQIDEAILKFLMTYRCTPHRPSGGHAKERPTVRARPRKLLRVRGIFSASEEYFCASEDLSCAFELYSSES